MISNNSYNEQELIQLIAQGDEQAFTKLFDQYHNRIYGFAFKLTHSTTVAEEITEDVFLKIWLKRNDLLQIQNFSAYLFTVARNETYKILRQIAKNYQTVLLAENHDAFAYEHLENKLIIKEFTSLLQKAIDRLPHQQKQVFQLIKQEQLKRHEVAQILHLQPETVKFHLAQAMKNIRAFCMLHLNLITGLVLCFIF